MAATPTQQEHVLTGYLTRAELAAQLGKSERTLDRWHSLRVGPPRAKVGRSPVYRIKAVQRWLVQQEDEAA
ncbi:MAG: transcriptional regulator [Proteobacteria bacterium]|nr:transcriptional regulator [Pseudomonadota bacterium]